MTPITDYLVMLAAELRLPLRRRRRVLREVEDHLMDAATDLHAAGFDPLDAEREAVRRFGAPGALARRFAEELAESEARRATTLAVAVAAVLSLLVFLVGGRAAPQARLVGLSGLALFVLVQTVAVTAVITGARSLRSRTGTPGRLVLIARGNAVIVSAAAVAAAIASVRVLHATGTLVHTTSGAAAIVATGVLVVLLVVAAVAAVTAALRTRALGVEPAYDEIAADDLVACARIAYTVLERRQPLLAGRMRAAAHRRSSVIRTLRAIDPHVRPWRFAVVAATLAGIALAVGHALGEGGPPRSLPELAGALRGALLLASIEAGCALLGYLLLGRLLALRGS